MKTENKSSHLTKTVPFVVVALDWIMKRTREQINKIPGDASLQKIQKTVLPIKAHILERIDHLSFFLLVVTFF